MAYFKLLSCKIKFQLCVGRFPDGRMRTRTFGIGGVRPDVSADDVAAVARALATLLAHPIVRVRLVRKYALETASAQGADIARNGAMPYNNRQNTAAYGRDTNGETEVARGYETLGEAAGHGARRGFGRVQPRASADFLRRGSLLCTENRSENISSRHWRRSPPCCARPEARSRCQRHRQQRWRSTPTRSRTIR